MRKLMKQHSILLTLFVPFTVLFILAFAVFMFYFIFTESDKVKRDSFVTMQNNVITISDSFDAEVTKLDTVSQNIIYSSMLKEEFSNYLEIRSGVSCSEAEKLKNKNTLFDLLISMIGPNTPVSQVYLYSLESGGIGVGLNNTDLDESVRDKHWYEAVIAGEGSKVVDCSEDTSLSKFSSSGDRQQYLSLCRVFYNFANVPQGIIEVKKPFDAISEMINGYQYSFSEEVFIFDPNGNAIYPMNAPKEAKVYYDTIIAQKGDSVNTADIIECEDKCLLSQTSKYTGYSTVIVVDQKELIRPIQNYLMTNLGLLFFIMVSIVILSFFIARFISRPLNHIYTSIKKFDLMNDRSVDLLEVDTHITELNALYDAFLKMQKKVRESMNRELVMQQREMQAKMLALQAQMNPHFLYNSLSTIQAMADEGMNSQIISMCQSMSRILRYISSDKEQMVTIKQEILHTMDFLKCMEARFEDDLTYTISLPEEMEEIRLPKLCLQLIVENSIKFMTKAKAPPWEIQIVGHRERDYWEIEVHDNGSGFTQEQLETLQEKIEQINQTGILPNLELNGMGLMNICIRLNLLYQGKHIFKLRNADTDGGAVVTIGGWNE